MPCRQHSTEAVTKKREQACKPNFVPRLPGAAIIPLAPSLLMGSSDLPGSCRPVAAVPNHCSRPRGAALTDRRYGTLRSGSLLLPYLVLLRAGFTLPSISLSRRCALTLSRLSGRTFSPLPGLYSGKPEKDQAVYFLWHFPCRRRTFAYAKSTSDPRR